MKEAFMNSLPFQLLLGIFTPSEYIEFNLDFFLLKLSYYILIL